MAHRRRGWAGRQTSSSTEPPRSGTRAVAFEIRDAETEEIFTTVEDMQYLEATLAPISEKIEHHNLRVTSKTPRITFVGWFVPDGEQ